jgi:hypothetical protein
MDSNNLLDACRAACENVGIIYKLFPPDNIFHVTDSTEGKPHNGAGRLKFFSDGQGAVLPLTGKQAKNNHFS